MKCRRLMLSNPPTMRSSLLPTLAVLLLLVEFSARAELVLVKDGHPNATIVTLAAPVPEAPAPVAPRGRKRAEAVAENGEAKAAHLLVDWIKKITDVELPIVTEAQPGTTPIYLGK